MQIRSRSAAPLLASSLLILLLLSSTAPSHAQEKAIRIGSQFSGLDWWEAMWAAFARQRGIRIESANIPWGQEGLEKFVTETAGGVGYDLVLMSSRWLASVVGSGLVVPLDAYVERDAFPIADFYPAVVSGLTYDGRLWAIPNYDVDVYIVYYNEEMFDAAGVGAPADDWTWDDYFEMMKRTTRIDPAGGRNQFGGGGLLWPVVAYSHGANVITADGRFDLDQGHVIEALQWSYDLRNVHHVFPQSPDEVGGVASLHNQFAEGYTATHWAGSWYARRLTDFRWGVAFPPASEYGRATEAFVGGWFIPTTADDPDLAWEIIKYMHSPDVLSDHFRQFSAVPVRRSIATSPDIAMYGAFGARTQAVLQSIPFGRVLPFHPLIDEIWSVIDAALERAYSGESTVRLVMEQLRPQVETILERMR